MADISSFLRYIRVTIGPLVGSNNGRIVTFESNGDRNSIRVDVVVNTSIMGIPKPSEITLYNLSQDTQNGIKRGLTKIIIETGIKSNGVVSYSKLFEGNIMTVQNTHESTENICKLSAIAGYASFVAAAASFSYESGTSVQRILKDIVGTMPGVTIDSISLSKITARVSAPYSFAGRTIDELNNLAGLYGFCWRIDNNIMYFQNDDMKISGKIYKVKTGGLISIAPILQGSDQVLTGVQAEVYYVPGVKAGNNINLDSKYSSNLNGTYIIHTCSTKLSTFDSTWTSSIECFRSM